jgi:branched-chain amino acid transport system ATP-binding protein
MSVLAVQGLGKSFGGVRALHDVSFQVDAGEIVALIGPNGAGKTTCFNIVNGQSVPDHGKVLVDGTDVTGRSPHSIGRMGVGRTFQIASTFASMSVIENVQTALLAHGGRLCNFWAQARALYVGEAMGLLESVGMRDQAQRLCGVLSYGDVKRVELAMALSNAPRLMLMDEPTAGMAPRERAQLMVLAASLARERRIGVLFTEHDMDVVFGHADRVLVLDRGSVIAQGVPEQVRADARVREIYLGSPASAAG